MTDNFTYNGFAEVDSYTANVNASAVFSNSFVRDKLGRISQKTETVQGVTHVFDYTYDTAGRLSDVDRDSLPFASYTYDTNGNRLNNGAVYDDQDRLTSTSSTTYTYTANGELLIKTNGSGTTTYSYDLLGNLISVVLPSGTTIDYLVDGKNRRIGKKVNGTLEKAWLYKDGLNPVVELDGTGTVVSRFVYATRSNVPDFIIKGGVTYRIVSDHLGSPRLVIDSATGVVIQSMGFDEFGNVIADTNPGFQPFGYGGGLYDADTKLVRFGARDYDAETGRWTSKDPIQFGGGDTNFYGYTVNDPINRVDFIGLDSYIVSRPLGIPGAGRIASHNFIVTNANYPGDPNATIHSFGELDSGNAGGVGPFTSPSGFSNTTSGADNTFWKNLSGGNSCDNITKIPAPDAVVDYYANSVVEDQEYHFLGILGINSNSIPKAVAEKATAGRRIETPGKGRISFGTSSSYRVNFIH